MWNVDMVQANTAYILVMPICSYVIYAKIYNSLFAFMYTHAK